MSQALYRKYRPKTFDEVYGQDGIVNILKNQIKNDKISHAYLFAGTRGTGKTSCAKIFSRAVNCLSPIDGNPCNECENCKRALEESSMDIVEMDAASNRRIDDIRQIRDTVIYPPTDLKYKVYIIDEAHMITNEGFNALLKIMEEPPRHLIFILATTEVDKIPDTILSRTQRFEFKKIERSLIKDRIRNILDKEGIKMDPLAIDSISNIGKGSMRDALSILDQVISIGKESFSKEDIDDILGIIGDETKLMIIKSALEADVSRLIEVIDRQLDKGKDAYNLIKEIIAFSELLMDKKIFGLGSDPAEGLEEILGELKLENIVNILDILLDYEERIKRSDNRNILLKMAMVRLVDKTPRDSLSAGLSALEERVSRLETNGVYIDERAKKNAPMEGRKPLSVEKANPFDALREEAEKDKKNTESSEDITAEANLSEGERSGSSIDSEGVEKFIERYMLSNFPASKRLFKEIRSFELKDDLLTYYVTSNGLNYSNIMTPLIKNAEKAYSEEKGKKIYIKFKLKEDKKKVEPIKKEESKIDHLKEFFGKDNIEIIN